MYICKQVVNADGRRGHQNVHMADCPTSLVVLTGFFGSGKTSFLLRALRLATGSLGLKTVLIQNEIGRAGVDPERFRSDDLVVEELLGGCLCCDLSARLVSMLSQVRREMAPDVVFVEASGVATPSMVRRLLEGTEFAEAPTLRVHLLDAPRLEKLEKALHFPLVQDGIRESDVCLVNKMDMAPDGLRGKLLSQVEDGTMPPRFVSLESSEQLPTEVEQMLVDFLGTADPPADATKPCHNRTHAHAHHGDPLVDAVERKWERPAPVDGIAICAALADLAAAVETAGGIIAHLKLALVDAGGQRHFLQLTSATPPPSWPAAPPSFLSRMVFNAICYQISEAQLKSLTQTFLCSFPDS